MAWYYSASERAFFSSELMSVDAMPADKVSVTDSAYKQLMSDQVAGKLIRTGSGNAPESVDQGLTAATRFGDVSFGKVTSTSIDLNGNGDVSGTWTVHDTLNAQGGLTVTDITATGTTTVVGLNAGNITASGTLAVNGATTLTGKLTANGGISTKALTATGLDLNGNGDVSGTLSVHGKTTLEDVQANGDLTVGGLLQVTGAIHSDDTIYSSADRSFASYIPGFDVKTNPSYELQWWPLNVYDKNYVSAAIVKYIKSSSGKSQFVFADLAYPNGSANWAQITVGHDEDGKGYFTTGLPSLFSGGLSVSGGEFSLLGSGVVDGTWTVNGNVKCYTINGKMLNVASSGGAHIVRQITGYTKGQVPSETYYSGHILYGSGATNQTGNRLAGNEIAISPLGNITYTFSCYEPVAGSTKTTSIRLGYSAGADSWINLSSDSINLAGRINANGYLYLNQGATVSNGEFSVENGGITCAKNIVAKGTQAFRLEDSVLDALTAPDTNIQRWPLGVYDKNGNALGYIKYNKSTDGKQSIQLLSRYLNSDGSYNLVGISVGHKPDGTFYSDIPHPVTDSNDNSIATTGWVQALLDALPGEETHICDLDANVTFAKGGSRICGTVLLQTYVSINSNGTRSDNFSVYVGSTKVATTKLTWQTSIAGGAGYGRSVEQTMIGKFEENVNVPSGSTIKLIRESTNIGGETRYCFAQVTVSR